MRRVSSHQQWSILLDWTRQIRLARLWLWCRKLVYCPKLHDEISESRNSHMQGVIRREWHALYQDDNAADGCFSARPEGSPQIPQSCVAVLVNGTTITGKLRLVLGNLGDSDFIMQFRTVH